MHHVSCFGKKGVEKKHGRLPLEKLVLSLLENGCLAGLMVTKKASKPEKRTAWIEPGAERAHGRSKLGRQLAHPIANEKCLAGQSSRLGQGRLGGELYLVVAEDTHRRLGNQQSRIQKR
jgi:hypothetical protein